MNYTQNTRANDVKAPHLSPERGARPTFTLSASCQLCKFATPAPKWRTTMTAPTASENGGKTGKTNVALPVTISPRALISVADHAAQAVQWPLLHHTNAAQHNNFRSFTLHRLQFFLFFSFFLVESIVCEFTFFTLFWEKNNKPTLVCWMRGKQKKML